MTKQRPRWASLFLGVGILSLVGLKSPALVQAQILDDSNPNFQVEILDTVVGTVEATSDAAATESGKLASPSAEVEQKIQEVKDKDITETGGLQKSKLAAYLDEHPASPLSWHNPLQHMIRKAIENGLPANIIVLMILFPLIASIIAASRHIVGLKGFGIYIPAVLSVAFVSTGIPTGIILFILVLVAAAITRGLVRKFRLSYLPRTAMLLLGVSLIILLLLLTSSIFNVFSFLSVNIFPLLIIMLLTENFMESQQFASTKEAIRLTIETVVIAAICAFLIGLDQVQQFVILRPEITLIGVTLTNWAIGKYTGLRLLEYLRFRSIID